jgi:hypothetical protein
LKPARDILLGVFSGLMKEFKIDVLIMKKLFGENYKKVKDCFFTNWPGEFISSLSKLSSSSEDVKGAFTEKVSEDSVKEEKKADGKDLTYEEASETIGADKSVGRREM